MSASDNEKQLQKDLKNNKLCNVYVIYGQESYLKEHYLKQIYLRFESDALSEFNVMTFENNNMSSVHVTNFIESYPVMSNRKLIVFKDLDLYKLNVEFSPIIVDLFQNKPEYLCAVFYCDTLELKVDKRLKIHKTIEKNGTILNFEFHEKKDLIEFVKNQAGSRGNEIDKETCEYLLFNCGVSMTNLINELDKLSSYCMDVRISRGDIDSICCKTLEAQVFDLTDFISDGKFDKAIEKIGELILLKNQPVAIIAVIARHLQRLYSAKVAVKFNVKTDYLMNLWGTRYTFYVNKMIKGAQGMDEDFIRYSIEICLQCDVELKSINIDKIKTVEFFILKIAEKWNG